MRILQRTLALVLLCAAPLGAQGNPFDRHGLSATVGVGVGSAGVTCDG